MVLEEDDRTGRGIPHISSTFNNKLVARLNSAPGDIMSFLQACAMGNLARVEELLEKGVDVNTLGDPTSPDVLSNTSGLMIATMSRQVGVVERLLAEENIDVDRRGKNGETALTIAALQGSNECMSLLLRAGAEIATVNNSGTTLTHNDISFSRQVRSGLGSRPHANGRFPRDRRKPRHRWVSWHRQRLGHPRTISSKEASGAS